MGALELLGPGAEDPLITYDVEPPTSGRPIQTNQQKRLGDVLDDGGFDDAGDPPTTVERRSSNVHTNHPALAAAGKIPSF